MPDAQITMSNYQIEKFTFGSPYSIVIDAKDSDCLYFKVEERILLADNGYGLEFIEEEIFGNLYQDHMLLDIESTVNRVRKNLALHAIEQGIFWLIDRFDQPQAIPIPRLPKTQLLIAIRLHYEGGWERLVQDCVKE